MNASRLLWFSALVAMCITCPVAVNSEGETACSALNDCNGHGRCNADTKTCECILGFGAVEDIASYKAPDCSTREWTLLGQFQLSKSIKCMYLCSCRYMSVRKSLDRYGDRKDKSACTSRMLCHGIVQSDLRRVPMLCRVCWNCLSAK